MPADKLDLLPDDCSFKKVNLSVPVTGLTRLRVKPVFCLAKRRQGSEKRCRSQPHRYSAVFPLRTNTTTPLFPLSGCPPHFQFAANLNEMTDNKRSSGGHQAGVALSSFLSSVNRLHVSCDWGNGRPSRENSQTKFHYSSGRVVMTGRRYRRSVAGSHLMLAGSDKNK